MNSFANFTGMCYKKEKHATQKMLRSHEYIFVYIYIIFNKNQWF